MPIIEAQYIEGTKSQSINAAYRKRVVGSRICRSRWQIEIISQFERRDRGRRVDGGDRVAPSLHNVLLFR
jgi:hypothetical protein